MIKELEEDLKKFLELMVNIKKKYNIKNQKKNITFNLKKNIKTIKIKNKKKNLNIIYKKSNK